MGGDKTPPKLFKLVSRDGGKWPQLCKPINGVINIFDLNEPWELCKKRPRKLGLFLLDKLMFVGEN